jgi:hypothetical protein
MALVVEAVSEGADTTAVTSHPVTLPAGIAATDEVLVLVSNGAAANTNALTGWTELQDDNVATAVKIFRYTGGGVPSDPTFVTSGATRWAWLAYRISGADQSIAPALGTTSTGTSATPNPPASATPPSSKEYLFIAVASMAGEEADDDTWGNTSPTNYTPTPPRQKTGGVGGNNLGGLILAAERLLTTGSAEDPGAFGVDVSAAWRAQTIMVHPAAAGTAHDPGTRADALGITDQVDLVVGRGIVVPDTANITDAVAQDAVKQIEEALALGDSTTAGLVVSQDVNDGAGITDSTAPLTGKEVIVNEPLRIADEAYRDRVVQSGPAHYYPDSSSAPWEDVIGNADIAITGATANQTGPLASEDTKAFLFDGFDDSGAVTLDLTDANKLTIEGWIWWDAYDTNNDLAMEFTTSWDLVAGGFIVNPNKGDGVNKLQVGIHGGISGVTQGKVDKHYPRPSAAAWHHVAFVGDWTETGGDRLRLYIDGSLVTEDTLFVDTAGSSSATFANATLDLMSRQGTGLFGAGRWAHLAIYKRALGQGEIAGHHSAGIAPSTGVRFDQGKVLSDSVGVTDAPSPVVTMARTLDDPLGVTDTATPSLAAFRTVDDPLGITDSAAAVIILLTQINDSLGMTDARTFDRGLGRDETINLTDAVALAPSMALTEALGLTDTALTTSALVRTLADAMGVTDDELVTQGRSLAESMGITDGIVVDLQEGEELLIPICEPTLLLIADPAYAADILGEAQMAILDDNPLTAELADTQPDLDTGCLEP